jgi:transposase-like protein
MPNRPGYLHRHRFPAEVISSAVWLYYRFPLSHRDVEELLAERGIQVSYETVRRWAIKVGPLFAEELHRRAARAGKTWHVDEVFLRMNGRRVYLWRAVDEQGQVLDILVQERRNVDAAERFFRRLLHQGGNAPERIVTDHLPSYADTRARCSQARLCTCCGSAEQSSGAIPPADASSGAQNAALQISRAGAAVPRRLQPSLQSLSSPPSPPPCRTVPRHHADSLPALARGHLRHCLASA